MMMFELIALLCTGAFTGAALYVSFVEHPARLECGPGLALAEFGPSYRRGAIMQASLAIAGFLAAALAWMQSAGTVVLAAGVLVGAIVPYTLIVILPTNKRLLDKRLDPASPEAAELLRRWGALHAIRTAVSTLAFVLLAWRSAT